MTVKTGIVVLIALLSVGAPITLNAQWTQVKDTIEFKVACFEGNKGVLFAGSVNGGIFRSADKGIEWSNSTFPYATIKAFINHGEYLLAATSRGMYRTSDNIWWHRADTGMESVVAYSFAIIGDTLFTGTVGKGVFRSTDNGSSWQSANTGLGDKMDVHSLRYHNGYLYAGSRSGIYRSSNRGDEWNQLKANIFGVMKVMVVSNGELYLGTTGSGVFRWDEENDTLIFVGLKGREVTNMFMIGGDMFAAVTTNGVFRSSDNGTTWTAINEGLTDLRMTGFGIVDGMLYASTESWGIWKRPLSEVLSEVEDNITSSSISSDLFVHPNPATERIIIRFMQKKSSLVTITLHDALGRIVTQPVVDAMQEAGEHQIALPTDGLAAGVYLCSVNAEGVERVVRFVVVR
jgi:hypothetical protein